MTEYSPKKADSSSLPKLSIQSKSSSSLDNDLLYFLKKKWTQFWNEPEFFTFGAERFQGQGLM